MEGVAEGVFCGLAKPPALGNPDVAGAGLAFGSGALNAELIGFTGSSLDTGAAEGVVCGLVNPALGNPEVAGAGFSFGSGALNAELMGFTGSSLAAAGLLI